MMRRFPGVRIVMALFAMAVLAGCSATPFRRTLPDWVRRLDVPMVMNKSYEAGLEDLMTPAIQEEVSSSPEFEVAPRTAADAVLKVIIVEYLEKSTAFASDEIESQREIAVRMRAELYSPKDMKRPFAIVKPFTVAYRHGSDYRSSSSQVDVDARVELARKCASVLVHSIRTQAVMDENEIAMREKAAEKEKAAGKADQATDESGEVYTYGDILP